MHHHFSSKFLIDSLNSHGFCASYKTVQKYERSAAVAQGTEIPGYTPGHFVQYSADNVDHDLRTLDGTGTFRGMGIIAAITPGTKATIPIPIRKVSAEDIAKVGRIEIRPFIGPLENTPLHYQELQKKLFEIPLRILISCGSLLSHFCSPHDLRGMVGCSYRVKERILANRQCIFYP